MPFALTFIGLLMVITGFQNTYRQFGSMVQGDFTGQNNFLYWMSAVGVIGGLGYVQGLQTFSRAFMGLILFVLIIRTYQNNPNIFSNFAGGIASGTTEAVNPIGAPLAGGSAGGGSSSSGGSAGNLLKTGGEIGSIVASIF